MDVCVLSPGLQCPLLLLSSNLSGFRLDGNYKALVCLKEACREKQETEVAAGQEFMRHPSAAQELCQPQGEKGETVTAKLPEARQHLRTSSSLDLPCRIHWQCLGPSLLLGLSLQRILPKSLDLN